MIAFLAAWWAWRKRRPVPIHTLVGWDEFQCQYDLWRIQRPMIKEFR